MNAQNNGKIFYKEKIRIGFYIQYKYLHPMLDPIYEILKEPLTEADQKLFRDVFIKFLS